MDAFSFLFPTKVEFGDGVLRKAGNMICNYVSKRALIITDKGVVESGILDILVNTLNSNEIDFDVFSGVEPNPTTLVLESALSLTKRKKYDCIIGLGGGSSIDTAKGVAAMTTNPGNILDYEGYNKVPVKPLNLIAIPTTSGTGSEGTASTVFTNSETLFKTVIVSEKIFPDLAILDPELTLKLPKSITAATGMDALTHAVESYVSRQSNLISKSLSIYAIKLIYENIEIAYLKGDDINARSNMLLASFLAGLAFSQSKLGNVHAISHTFGGMFNIPHGIANAALLPYVVKFNIPACPSLFKDIAIALGENTYGLSDIDAANKVVDKIIKLNKSLDIPSNIKSLGVDLELIDKMVSDAMRSGNVTVNPRKTSANDIKMIIENSFNGIIKE